MKHPIPRVYPSSVVDLFEGNTLVFPPIRSKAASRKLISQERSVRDFPILIQSSHFISETARRSLCRVRNELNPEVFPEYFNCVVSPCTPSRAREETVLQSRVNAKVFNEAT